MRWWNGNGWGVGVGLVAVCGASCGDLEGFGGPVSPLATYTVLVPTAPSVPLVHPSAALVWGMQWLTEALCILPPENPQAATVLAAGCRDPFGFVPLRVETNFPVTIGEPKTFSLFNVPGSDVLVGDVTSRVAYGTIVFYDDVNDIGLLDLARPNRLGTATGMPITDTTPTVLSSVIYGASFISMTLPDQRVGYVEGSFDPTAAFYPRAGCPNPPLHFSVLAASGFTEQAAVAATLSGTLPQETDLSQCAAAAPSAATIVAPLAPPTAPPTSPTSLDINEVACTENNADSEVRYREPTDSVPDFTGRSTACVHLPTLGSGSGSAGEQQIELIVTGVINSVANGPPLDSCKGLTHYILRGCANDPGCVPAMWDHTDDPPPWWPCPTS